MKKKTILLVEDDIVFMDVLKEALAREYNVLEASKYSEAIEQLKSHIDLAIIDYVLPDRDGFNVINAIREIKPELPVILITAYSTKDLAIKALREKITDYIEKPLSLAYLKGKISEALGRKNLSKHPEKVGSREEFIMDCTAAFIENNYREELTRDKLAEKAGMDRYKFSTLFNEMFGQSIRSYLNSVRIKMAEELLKNHYLSIKEIAYSVGYKNIVHFNRVFKKINGLSPIEYRRNQTKLH